jgi:hypothetical protein
MKHRYKLTLLIKVAWWGRGYYGIQDWFNRIERDAMVAEYLNVDRYKLGLLLRAAWCGRGCYGIQDWRCGAERHSMVVDYIAITRGNHPTTRTPYNWADAK